MGAAENKQIVQTMYAELAKGRLRPYLEPMADDLRLTIIGTTKYSGTINGKAAYEKFLRALPPLFEGRVPLLTPENFIAEGDYVVAQLRGQATAIKGKPYNNGYCMVFRFANGKIQQIMEYLDTELINSVFT
jgi:ketosteroid isomerase-like protein